MEHPVQYIAYMSLFTIERDIQMAQWQDCRTQSRGSSLTGGSGICVLTGCWITSRLSCDCVDQRNADRTSNINWKQQGKTFEPKKFGAYYKRL